MNGKLPANCFTCSQGYLRPNILHYQRDPQIQQSQNQAKPTLPLYIVPGESISPCISGLGCTDSNSPQKGLSKDALNKPEEQPFVITKYDWHTSALVFSEKPSLFDQDRALAVLNGEKLYIEEAAEDSNENPPIEPNNMEEIKNKDLLIKK